MLTLCHVCTLATWWWYVGCAYERSELPGRRACMQSLEESDLCSCAGLMLSWHLFCLLGVQLCGMPPAGQR